MSMPETLTDEAASKPAAESVGEEKAKRRQIMGGARAVFLAQGFDAASMGEIARAAGVSKGTLYVYFASKEELFEAFARGECLALAEQIFSFEEGNHDVGAVLMRVGTEFVEFLCRPEAISPLRTVIGIADRMPHIGKRFFESGPARGAARLSLYLRAQVEAGVLAIEDCDVAAAQFIDACQATLFKPILFNAGPIPGPDRIRHVVSMAVRAFMRAYGR